MRFGFLSIPLLIGTGIALSLEGPPTGKDLSHIEVNRTKAKDAAVVDNWLNRISGSLSYTKTIINGLPRGGDMETANREALRLLDQLVKLSRELSDGARDIKNGPSISAIEAGVLLLSINNMSSLTSDCVNGLMTENTKMMVWTAGKQNAQNRFASELKLFSKANQDFTAAMTSKVPPANQGVGAILKAGFNSIIDPAIKVYTSRWSYA